MGNGVADDRALDRVADVAWQVRLWAPRVETGVYRLIAGAVARVLGRLDGVRSVYARRSVASEEVVLARSDVDLHVIVAPLGDSEAEGRFLAVLARRIRWLRRLVPILGDCDVSTRAELDVWYAGRPGNWFRDHGWLRLWGEPYERPAPPSDVAAARDSIVRWAVLALQKLPELVHLGRAHHTTNVLADLVYVRSLLRGGPCDGRRAEVLERWRREEPGDPRRARLASAYADAFRRDRAGIVPMVQGLVLEVVDALASDLCIAPDADAGAGGELRELRAKPPFSYAPRRYLLPDPSSEAAVGSAVAEARRDASVAITSLGTLALQLRFFRPFEWEGLARANASLRLPRPLDADYLDAVRYSLHRELLRSAGFGLAGATAAELRLVQCRVFLDAGRVAESRDDLSEAYAAIYGAPPAGPPSSTDEFFLRRYPKSARLIDELSAHPRLA